MTQKRFDEAYRIFKRIARSNRRKLNECIELQKLRHLKENVERQKLNKDIQFVENPNDSDQAIEKHVEF